MEDTRNVIDDFKHKPIEDIVAVLDEHATGLEIAIENTVRDFNMGSIVRSANAFGVRHIHIIGRRQWNKRGAMATDKYLHLHHHATLEDFSREMGRRQRSIIAIDNVPGSSQLSGTHLPKSAVLVFGQEGPGITKELLSIAEEVIAIEQFGSTRSINVGVAAGIAMYAWLQQHSL